MIEPALLDNDVVLKLCRYGCHAALPAALDGTPAAVIGVARYAMRDRVRRSRSVPDKPRLLAALEEALASFSILQPDEDEATLAAAFEEEAARRALEFDSGESQLLAILLRRGSPLLLTGDKRAIRAMHDLGVAGVDGRVACLEQLTASLLDRIRCADLRAAVCADREADRTLTACFACSSDEGSEARVREGLSSYVRDLRSRSGGVLRPGDDLSASCTARPMDAQR